MERDAITLADIFMYKQSGIDENGKVNGNFGATGVVPSFIKDVKTHGLNFDIGVFKV